MYKKYKDVMVGDVFDQKDGRVTVLEIVDKNRVKVAFSDPYYERWTSANALNTSNNIKNRNKPSVYGVGYLGVGPYKAPGCAHNEMLHTFNAYNSWVMMLQRVYKSGPGNIRLYSDVTVCDEWHNFQNYAEWFESSMNQYHDWQSCPWKWHVDKDLYPQNRIYSPKTCFIVPTVVNQIFKNTSRARGKLPLGVNKHVGGRYVAECHGKYVGIYQTVEEARIAYWNAKLAKIREIANMYKEYIPKMIYDKLSNFTLQDAIEYHGEAAFYGFDVNTGNTV